MDSGQEESDFGIKIDAVFSLASTETEADECSRNATSDYVQADEEKKPKCTESDSKSCEVRMIDIFDEKIVREYWKIYRGYPFSKQPTSQGSKVEECKNFDVIFAKDAVYERGKRKRKFNAHVKGPEYVESPPSRWMNRKKIKIGPEKSKFKYLKVSPVVIKQKKRVLFERNKHIVSRSVSVERLVEAANHFLSLPGKSKPALVYRPQVARTKKKLRKPDPEINLARTSSPSPPRLEPVSERIETVLDEKPPKLEPEFSDLNLDFEDASLSLSLSGRYRKKNKRLGKEFVTKKKRKVAKVTPLQTKEPGSLASTSISELQSSTGASSYTPRMQSILKKSPTDHEEVSAEEMSTDFLPARPIKTPEFTAAVNKLAKKENTKKFFQLKIGDKIVLIPTDGNAVMPKAFVLDNPTKSDPTTPIFQTARPVPKETVFGVFSNPTKETVDEESLQAAQESRDDHSYLQSIKQEPPDDAYIMPNSQEVKSNTEYFTPDHDYMTPKHGHDTTNINDVKPYPADATSFQKDKKPDKKQTTPSGSRYLQYVEASLSPVNPDIVLLRLKSNDKTKAVPKLPQPKKLPSVPQRGPEVVVLPTEKQALKIQDRFPNSYSRSILPKGSLPPQSGGQAKSLIIPKLTSSKNTNLTKSIEIAQQALNNQNLKLLTSSSNKAGSILSKKPTSTSSTQANISLKKIPIQKLPKQSTVMAALKQKVDKPEVTHTATSDVNTMVATVGPSTGSLAKLPNGNLVYILNQEVPTTATSQASNYHQMMLSQSSGSNIISLVSSAIPSSIGLTQCTSSLLTQSVTSPLFTISTSPLPTSSSSLLTSSSSPLMTSSLIANVPSSNTSFDSNSSHVKVIHPPTKTASQISNQTHHEIQISKDRIVIPCSTASGAQSASSALKYLSNVHRSQLTDQLVVKMPFEKSADALTRSDSDIVNDEQLGEISSVDTSIVKQEPVDDLDTVLRMPQETEQEEENMRTEQEEETVNIKQEIDEVSEEVDVGENSGNDNETESETESEGETQTTSHLQYEHLTLDNGNTATFVTEHVPPHQNNEAGDKIRRLREMLRVQKEKIEKLRKSNLLSS